MVSLWMQCIISETRGITIYSFADGKPIMYEKGFLLDVAEQNFEKYSVNQIYPGPVKVRILLISWLVSLIILVWFCCVCLLCRRGKWWLWIVPMTSALALGTSLRSLINLLLTFHMFLCLIWTRKLTAVSCYGLNGENLRKWVVNLCCPTGVLIAFTWPCFHSSRLLGMVGLDVHLGEIVEDVTYFAKNKNAEAFLIDHHGQLSCIACDSLCILDHTHCLGSLQGTRSCTVPCQGRIWWRSNRCIQTSLIMRKWTALMPSSNVCLGQESLSPVRDCNCFLWSNHNHFPHHSELEGNASLTVPRYSDASGDRLYVMSPTITYTYMWKHLSIKKVSVISKFLFREGVHVCHPSCFTHQMESSPFIAVVKIVRDGSNIRKIRNVHG